jgi:hypothetical protein
VFWRRDQKGIPIVVDSKNDAAWRVAADMPIDIHAITEQTNKEIWAARDEASREAQIAANAEDRYYAALSELERERHLAEARCSLRNYNPPSYFGYAYPSSYPSNPNPPLSYYSYLDRDENYLLERIRAEQLEVLEARQKEAAATSHTDTATRALQNAQSINNQVDLAAQTAVPKPIARLTRAEEQQLRVLIDALSSDDTPTRRGARTDLTKWLAALSPEKQPTTVDVLLNKLSRKSYRYQLGIAMAVADQPQPLFVSDRAQLATEIYAAEKAPAGKDATLRKLLEGAKKGVTQAKEGRPP